MGQPEIISMIGISFSDWFSIIVIGFGIITFIIDLAYLFTHQTRQHKKPFKFASAMFCWYFIILYINAISHPEVYYIRAGIFGRLGVIGLLLIHTLDTISDWKRIKCRLNF